MFQIGVQMFGYPVTFNELFGRNAAAMSRKRNENNTSLDIPTCEGELNVAQILARNEPTVPLFNDKKQ